jgi:hypothetical protein
MGGPYTASVGMASIRTILPTYQPSPEPRPEGQDHRKADAVKNTAINLLQNLIIDVTEYSVTVEKQIWHFN